MFSSPACELWGLRTEAEAAALSLLRHRIYGLPLGKEICSRPLGFSLSFDGDCSFDAAKTACVSWNNPPAGLQLWGVQFFQRVFIPAALLKWGIFIWYLKVVVIFFQPGERDLKNYNNGNNLKAFSSNLDIAIF
jgi:hypothetical protein